MAKRIFRILDNLSPSEAKLTNIARKANGLNNFYFNEYGQLVKRKGYVQYNTNSIGAAHKIVGLHRFYQQDTASPEFLAAWNTNIYKLSSASGHAATIIYGNEIHTQANAAADPNSAEANGTTGWSSVQCTISSVTTDPQTGTYHLKGVADDGTNDQLTYSFTAVVGRKYYVSIWAKRGAQGTTQYIKGWTGVTSSPSEAIAAGAWAEYTNTVTANATTIKIVIYAAVAGAASDEVYIDNVSITELLTADSDTYFVNFYDSCYMVNGVDGMFKYDMTNFRKVGITPPAAAPTGTSPATGSLSEGNYKVKYTYVDEDGYESNASAASANIACSTDDKITLTIVNSTDSKVVSRNIYRTSVNGALYYYDKAVANNTATSVDLTQADTTLSQGTVLHTNHNAPTSTPHLITKRRTRAMLADNDKFYWSHAGDAEYFPAAWFIRTSARQEITGLIEQKEWLSVFTEDTIERLTGQDEGNFEFQNTYSGEGCIAPRSLVSCNNLNVYLGVDGIYQFNGVLSKILHIPLSEYIKANINATYAHLSCATFFNNKYLLSYPKDDSEVPDETVYIDFRTGATGIYNFGFSCYSKWDRGTDGLQLYSGSNTAGIVYRTLYGLKDNTAVITCYDRTEPIDLGKPDIYKQWFDIYIKVKTLDGIETATELAVGTTPTKVASSAFTYSIAGTQYSKTAVAAGTTPGDDVIPEDKYGCVAFDIGTNETIDAIEASANATGYNTAELAVAGLPAVATGHVRMGYVTVMKSDGTFTFGTTSLSATNVTAAYTDLIGIAMTMYYTLDDEDETSKSLTLTANTTKWYRIKLAQGGQRARAISLRPYVSDKYDLTIMGYALVFEEEDALWLK